MKRFHIKWMLLSLFIAVPAWALPYAPMSKSAVLSYKRFPLKKSSFTENWQRYPSPDVIIKHFRQLFPDEDITRVGSDCSTLTDQNRALLGDSDPSMGRPALESPNSSFANWYNGCLVAFIKSEDSVTTYEYDAQGNGTTHYPTMEDLEKRFTRAVVGECSKNDWYFKQVLKEHPDQIEGFYCSWNELSQEAKTGFARQLVERFIGPEGVIVDLGIAESEDQLINALLTEVESNNQKPDSKYDFLLSEASKRSPNQLSVIDVRKMMEFLLGIQDSLRY